MSPSRGSANANQCCKRGRISRPTPARLEVCRWSALFLAHFLPTWLVIFFLATAYSSHAPVEDRAIQRFGLHQAHHYYRVMRETNTPWGLPQGIPHQPWFQRRRTRFWSAKHQIPYNVIMILPGKESNNDKFGLTIDKAMPVIDIAIEDIVHSQIMPEGWINITYHDSRVWEDTLLAERYATVGVVQAYCEHRLDAIFGFADSYSLATVSKVSAGFGHGVPIITTTGLNSQIGSKRSYPYVTRMTGSYWQMAQSTYQFIAHHQEEEQNSGVNSTNLNYKNLVFMYHDKKRAINRHQVMGENADDTVSSHCYFSLHSIKNYFREKSEHFKESWKVQTPYWPFDEEENRKENDTKEWVKMASNAANEKKLEI
ncbi:receptor-type guanylate cyclase gcy-28 [Ditylenchus destructor]|uniref:Receptor-type guanylate cyclase gcy-28 n=1 Tax=Ditylenchus destructor TaxID=166010 RepID=A0AAD4NC04_9BILA|nr:receptor-type guanylate cyclase gcy-28 [Ditylenchus destructor]